MLQFARSLLICGLCTPLIVNIVSSGWSLYNVAQLRPPTPPAALQQRGGELKAALDHARPYFDGVTGIRPEVLALAAAVGADHIDEDPTRPADKAMLEAVGEHADLLARTTELLRRITDPNGPKDVNLDPPPTDASYNDLLVARREALNDEKDLRKLAPTGADYNALLNKYLQSPGSNQRLRYAADQRLPYASDPTKGKTPDPPAPGNGSSTPGNGSSRVGISSDVGDTLVLVPGTQTAANDLEFCQMIGSVQQTWGAQLIGGGVQLVLVDPTSPRGCKVQLWPAQGLSPVPGGLIDDKDAAAAHKILGLALNEDGRVQGARPSKPLRTLIVWRSDGNLDDDDDTTRVIKIPGDRLHAVELYCLRQSKVRQVPGKPREKLRNWFPDGNSYVRSTELDSSEKAIGLFIQQSGGVAPK